MSSEYPPPIPDETPISEEDLRKELPPLALSLLKLIKAYNGFENAQSSGRQTTIANNGHGKRTNYGVPTTAFEFVDALGAEIEGSTDTEEDALALDFDLNLLKSGPGPIDEFVDMGLCCGGSEPMASLFYRQDQNPEKYNTYGALRKVKALIESIPMPNQLASVQPLASGRLS